MGDLLLILVLHALVVVEYKRNVFVSLKGGEILFCELSGKVNIK